MWRGSVLFAVVFIASACAAPRVADPTLPPSVDPTSALNAPAGPVLFEPEQIILPPEEFPIAQSEVSRDAPLKAHAWERQFATPGSADFRWFTVRLFVFDPDVSATRFVQDNGCGSVSWPDDQPAAKEVDPPRTGDAARACRYGFADGARVMYLATGFRNVGVLVAAQPRRDEVSDALAVQWLSAIGKQQIAIIGRVMLAKK